MRYKCFALILIGILSLGQLNAQDYTAIKSDATIQQGGEKYYVHTVEKGNTLYNISKTYNVAVNVIVQLNPELKEGLKIGMELKIPYHTPQADDYIYHIVKKKETLYQISKIYNVRVDDIIAINDIVDGKISEGQYLKIPSMFVNANTEELYTKAKEVQAQKIIKPENKKYKIYKVQPKETLFTISKRYGISVDALMYLNDMDSPDLSLGQEILVPRRVLEQEDQSFDSDKYILHKVKPKETLYGIAKQYAVPMDVILKNNQIQDQQIQIGQKLLIPRQLNETGFIKHKVSARREKLSKIAGKYNVSVSALKNANPRAGEKLKRGETLLIPLGYVETDFEEEEELIEEEKPTEEIVSYKECQKQLNQEKRYQIALMLPLYLDEVDSLMVIDTNELLEHQFEKPFKFLEFYEGALLAAKEMDSLGFEYDLHVYDIPRDVAAASEVLKTPELVDMDLMITLLYSQSFDVVSEFSKQHQIPLVNVLSKRRKVIYDNPNVFKIEPNSNNLYQQAIDYTLAEHRNDNIIIVRSNQYQLSSEYKMLEEGLKNKIPYLVQIPHSKILGRVSKLEMDYPKAGMDFQALMTQEFKNELPGFDYERVQSLPEDSLVVPNRLKTVVYSVDSLDGIINASSLFRNNLILALGSEEVFGIELFTKLNFVRDSFNYEVIGMPDWYQYNGIDVAYTQPMKLKVFTNRFVDYAEPEAKRFVLNFRKEYGIEPQIERYAFLGYDVTKYFLTALKDYGKEFQNCLDEVDVKLLENKLEFKKIPDAGYENQHWNMLFQQDFQYYIID